MHGTLNVKKEEKKVSATNVKQAKIRIQDLPNKKDC